MSYIQVQRDDHDIAWIGLDTPDSKVNTLGSEMMRALSDAIDKHQSAPAMVFYSCKSHQFIAGADINELAAITIEKEAEAKSRLGQEIFNKISSLQIPTLAIINGPSMGGGTELALACTWRLMTDHPKVSIALPEVRLGIIPGWGGTQRLPRLIGFAAAVDMMCTGRSIRGQKCKRMGLVDGIINDAFWREHSTAFIQEKIAKPRKRKAVKLGMMGWFLSKTGIGRSLVLKKAKQAIQKQGGSHYPAPLALLDLLAKTYASGPCTENGFEQEAQAFAALSQTAVSQYLVQLFLANESAKKQGADQSYAAIQHVGVLGAGIMGGGIAWLFSQKGMRVRVKDINWDALSKAFQTAAGIYKGLVKRRRMKRHEMNVAMARLSGGLDMQSMRHSDVVIEAVIEKLDIKRSVLQEAEEHIAADATLCSNTSSLTIDDMAVDLKHPERFVGMHFFNPVNKMPLVEVVAGSQSDEAHVARIAQLSVQAGKTPVVVKDCPGFLVNRLLMPYMNEAVLCAQEGADIEQVDRVLKEFGMPMGPFLLADEVGIDVCAKVAQNLQDAYGERMQVAALLKTIYEDLQLLGKKSGKGFYVHGKKKTQLNRSVLKAQRKTMSAQTADTTTHSLSDDDIRDRCILIMVNEAARCLDEGIVRSAADLDLAMIMGTGFPPFRGGLMHYADAYGPKTIVKRLHQLHSQVGMRFEVAPALLAYAEAGGFYTQAKQSAD